MMLPILISVSVAPGSYFLVCAPALLASAVASSTANAILPGFFLASFKTRSCMVVPPDVPGPRAQSLVGQLVEPLDRMRRQYARLGSCYQQALHYFPQRRRCWIASRFPHGADVRAQGLSNVNSARRA